MLWSSKNKRFLSNCNWQNYQRMRELLRPLVVRGLNGSFKWGGLRTMRGAPFHKYRITRKLRLHDRGNAAVAGGRFVLNIFSSGSGGNNRHDRWVETALVTGVHKLEELRGLSASPVCSQISPHEERPPRQPRVRCWHPPSGRIPVPRHPKPRLPLPYRCSGIRRVFSLRERHR